MGKNVCQQEGLSQSVADKMKCTAITTDQAKRWVAKARELLNSRRNMGSFCRTYARPMTEAGSEEYNKIVLNDKWYEVGYTENNEGNTHPPLFGYH